MSNARNNVKTLTGLNTTVDPGDGGFWPNITTTARIHRMRDRLFVGMGAESLGTYVANQAGIVPTATVGANWAPRDSSVFVAQDIGLMGITAFVTNENQDFSSGNPTEAIGLSAFTINKVAGKTTWAGYLDVQHEAGLASYGMEIAAKNLTATDSTDTPYSTVGGVYGIWFAGGGDSSYGGTATNPSNTAIKIGRNATGSAQPWNKGIVFVSNGLTGSDGTTGTATAIEMGYGQQIVWRAPGNYGGFAINSEVSTNGANSSLLATDNNIIFKGAAGQFLLQLTRETSGVNYLRFYTRAAGSGPRLEANGTDTDIDLELIPKGTGLVRFGTYSALAAETLSGYVYIKDAGGTTRKVAVIA